MSGRKDVHPLEYAYVSGDMSCTELANEYGISPKTVSKFCYRDGWVKKRKEFRESVRDDKLRLAHMDKVQEKERFDEKTDRSCDLIIGQVEMHLALAALENENAPDDEVVLMSTSRLKVLADIIGKTQDVKYRRLDVPAPLQRTRDENVVAPADELDDTDEMLEQATRLLRECED